jgi:hypothetical protein
MMTLDQVMEAERRALTTEYLLPAGIVGGTVQVPPYTAIPDTSVLIGTPLGLRTRHPIDIKDLPGRDRDQAFIQLCPSLDYKFLWVHAGNENYRQDYLSFLRAFHQVTLEDLPSTYHVDHLFNRARAGNMFIRMILLPRGVNTSHGGGYEGARTRAGVGRSGRERSLDEINLMKLWGIYSPRKNTPPTPQMLAHMQRVSVIFGIPMAEIERNIRELMAVANFTPSA